MMSSCSRQGCLIAAAILSAGILAAQNAPKITTPKEALGFNIGDDYQLANYTQLEAYWKKLASESDRMKLVNIGSTSEGRPQYMAVITSPANMKKLDHYKEISKRLAHAEGLTDEQAHALANEGKAVIWIDGGLHASETVGAQQLMEMVYQMVSRTDPETMRFLNDVILLCTQVNPDGQELVANWYMRRSEKADAPLLPPEQRSLAGIPRLWNKYTGHDDNRDFFMSNISETININRQLWIEWFPQILYNHHQTGPAGGVIFMPPFRDPFNFNYDPLIVLKIDQVGAAMHERLVEENKPGSEMRSGSNYSTWWNGGLRTIAYFHNSVGLLTEIIGEPTPIAIPLVPEKQLPKGDWPMPVPPGPWHYRQSIDYEITNNRAVLDLASRYRDQFLYDMYLMGKNSIEKGSRDNWTISPKRITALDEAAAQTQGAGGRGGRGGAAPAGARAVPSDLYNAVLHDPKLRDARAYIVPSDQPDWPNAVEFVNTLLKNGIDVMRATAAFQVAGKSYPAGSFVVKTAQAFRPYILDMFEPQDHPNDFQYPGGPPIPPYDMTGWTLTYQMGVKVDRILDGFDGPFQKLPYIVLPPPPAAIKGSTTAAGYLISHQINNSFRLINRLLAAKADVYWLKKDQTVEGQDLGDGAIWVPASASAKNILDKGSKEFGVPVYALAKAPSGDAIKLKPIRVGLYDQYGGLMPAGWTRLLFEQYEVPFKDVYPATLDAGDLKSKFDVIVFVDGAIRLQQGGRGGGRGGSTEIPAQYADMQGTFTVAKTVPQLKKFVESGGSIVTIGGSTEVAEALGLPVRNYLTEMGPDGKERPLPREKFYVPGALLKMTVDNSNPLAYGMPKQVDVMYDNNPVFKLEPTVELEHTAPVGWFSGPKVLDSGWAWGQQYLDGGTAVAEAAMGEGKVFLLGPLVNFRDQPHATYKLLFNGLYFGNATSTTLQ